MDSGPGEANSHNACRCVKRHSKRTGKAHFFLRSAGVSTVAKVLLEAAAPDADRVC